MRVYTLLHTFRHRAYHTTHNYRFCACLVIGVLCVSFNLRKSVLHFSQFFYCRVLCFMDWLGSITGDVDNNSNYKIITPMSKSANFGGISSWRAWVFFVRFMLTSSKCNFRSLSALLENQDKGWFLAHLKRDMQRKYVFANMPCYV